MVEPVAGATPGEAGGCVIGAALALSPGGVEVDPLTGHVSTDARLAGLSQGGQAALEWALQIAQRWGGSVVAVTAGPAPASRVLRDALAAGADRAIRVELAQAATATATAAALAPVLATQGACLVVCGAAGTAEGSGAVPALLAHHLGAAQALGLVSLDVPPERGPLGATRRLDGGRRERLAVPLPAVVSVEGSTARLRRASLARVLAAKRATIATEASAAAALSHAPAATLRPYRPRPKVVAAPRGGTALERVRALNQVGAPTTPPRTVVADPAEAAEAVLAQLREWGELDG